MSFVNAGMGWSLEGDEYCLRRCFFTWLSSVRERGLFKATSCTVTVPMMDIALTDSPILKVLRQWQYERPKGKIFVHLGNLGGIWGQTYPL